MIASPKISYQFFEQEQPPHLWIVNTQEGIITLLEAAFSWLDYLDDTHLENFLSTDLTDSLNSEFSLLGMDSLPERFTFCLCSPAAWDHIMKEMGCKPESAGGFISGTVFYRKYSEKFLPFPKELYMRLTYQESS